MTSQDLIYSFGYDPKNETFLRIYYRSSAPSWEPLVPFNKMIAVYAYICEKLAWYGLNASAVIIVILSRAVSLKFKSLYLQGEEFTSASTKEPSHGKPFPYECLNCFKLQLWSDATLWRNIAQDHHALLLGLSEIKDFLSPLVFVNIGMSTYVICLQVKPIYKAACFAGKLNCIDVMYPYDRSILAYHQRTL